MDLEKATAVMRPRSYWEAVDLGFGMVRSWRAPVFASWLAVVVPAMLAISVAFWNHPSVAAILVWWIKPLFDRVPLFVLSRRLFGETPSVKETVAALPGLLKGRATLALTVYRLDPVRSFNLAIWQLEGLSGKARGARSRVLEKGCYNEASQLMLVCAAFESILAAGLIGVAFLMMPDPDPGDWLEGLTRFSVVGAPLALQWLLVVPYFAAMIIVEPFYVAGGFGLYLNRRTRLEAWDVEIAFRNLTRRLGSATTTGLLVLAAIVTLTATGMSRAADAAPAEDLIVARNAPAPAPGSLEPESRIRRILSDPEFGGTRHTKSWRLKEIVTSAPEEDRASSWRLENFGEAFAAFTQPVLWAVMLGALVWIFARARLGGIGRGARGSRTNEAAPATVSGLDVRPEGLPGDIPQAAGRLWEEGKGAEALGLLYRGALARLVHVDKLPLTKSFTEGDCLRVAASRLAAGRAAYFRALTLCWQSAAYARRAPGNVEAAKILDGWREHFGVPG